MATKPGCHQPVDKCKIGVPKGRCRVLPEFAGMYHTRLYKSAVF
jgi:hypothetical protein